MKLFKTTVIFLFLLTTQFSQAQTSEKLYDPDADANIQIAEAVRKAKAEGKHVFIQVGGDWCKWCRIFHKWSHENPVIDSLFNADYIMVHLNHSKENENNDVLEKLEFPQRFGFPVFVILDSEGKRLHTQNTAYLEEGEGYSVKRVKEFLLSWNVKALSSSSYK